MADEMLGEFAEVARHIRGRAEILKASVKYDPLIQIQQFGSILADICNIMGDNNYGYPAVLVQGFQGVEEYIPGFRIKCRGRFIQD